MIPEYIKTRLFRNGLLRTRLREVEKLLELNPESNFAKRVFKLLTLKYFFGARKVNFASICEEAWEIIPFTENDDIFIIKDIRFVDDIVLKSEFAEIFFGDIDGKQLDYGFNSEQKVASRILGILSDGPYTFGSFSFKDNDVVIDAGANMGVFSIYASKYTTGKIYAFEPQKEAIRLLEKNIGLNLSQEQISIVPYGLSDFCGTAGLSVSHGSHSASSIVIQRNEDEEHEIINCTTLDAWAKENNITKIDFIKADIEGAERKMLIGAQEILKTMAPKLAICTYHLADDPEVIEQLILQANPNYKIIHTSKKLFASV